MGSCYTSDSDRKKNELPSDKALCKIVFQGKNSYGFLIKLLKGTSDFFCLIVGENFGKTNSEKVNFYFDNGKQSREIILNPKERHIEFLNKININLIVIELLPKDNMPLNYFLLPDMNYENNIDELLNKDIISYNNELENLCIIKEKILSIKENENEFSYSAKIPLKISGYPIFLKNNSSVIGINKISSENKNENNGYFILPILNYFKNYKDKEEEELNDSIIKEEIPNDGIPAMAHKLNNFPKFFDYISDKNIDLDNIPKIRLNQMTINYLIEKNSDKIRLFCGDFVKNNEDKCYLIIDGKKHALVNYLILNESQKKRKYIAVKLIEYKPITDFGFMFFLCPSVLSIMDFNNWDTQNVTKMNSMFHGCILLESLPHLSDWDTKNVTDMSCMFLCCGALKYLRGIENWDTRNVIKMNSMFGYCKSLITMPDISNWNTEHVINMNWMFIKCESLRIFPDISKWKLNKNVQTLMMFFECQEDIIPEKFKK